MVVDMTNQRFGKLVVLYRVENDRFGKAQWLCQCDCGKQKVINGASLRRGLTVSCGCNALSKIKEYNEKQVKNEVGNTYGYLTVVSRNLDPSLSKDGRAMWNCVCKCGNTCVASGKWLRAGHTTSCGCRRQSLGEEAVENLLLSNNIEYAKEYHVDIRKEKIYQHHKARFDFAIFKDNILVYFIEYDGEQHFEENVREQGRGWNSRANFEKTHERDILKNQWCKNNNIPLIRIPYWHFKKLCIEDLLLETSNFIVKDNYEQEEIII